MYILENVTEREKLRITRSRKIRKRVRGRD